MDNIASGRGMWISATRNAIPHILFVLDYLPAHKGGIYAIVRWIIQLLRSFNQSKAVHIACTTRFSKKEPQIINSREYTSAHGIKMIFPDFPRDKSQLEMDDLNSKPRQYYRQLTEFKDITHVVLVAPISITSDLPNMLKDSGVHPKVIILTQLTKFETKEVKLAQGFNVDTIICVGKKVYESVLMKTKQFNKAKQICVYPTFFELEKSKPSKGFSVVTLYNEYNIYPIPHGSNKTLGQCFLETAAQSLGQVAEDMQNALALENKLDWCIHWPGLSEESKEKWRQKLKEVAHSEYLEINFVSENDASDEDISTLVGMYTMCLQNGYLDMEGYNGLETMLCGTPTLVMQESDVSDMIRVTTSMIFQNYFTLANYNDENQIKKWKDVLKMLLKESEVQNTFKNINTFQKRYFESEEVTKGIEEVIKCFTGAELLRTDVEQHMGKLCPKVQEAPPNNQNVIIYAENVVLSDNLPGRHDNINLSRLSIREPSQNQRSMGFSDRRTTAVNRRSAWGPNADETDPKYPEHTTKLNAAAVERVESDDFKVIHSVVTDDQNKVLEHKITPFERPFQPKHINNDYTRGLDIYERNGSSSDEERNCDVRRKKADRQKLPKAVIQSMGSLTPDSESDSDSDWVSFGQPTSTTEMSGKEPLSLPEHLRSTKPSGQDFGGQYVLKSYKPPKFK